MNQHITGRFAPTPSGRLHLGNLLCCLIAYLSARSQGGRFLLRIEDLDVPRCPKRLSDQCIEDLRFLGFDWDEPPIWQSQRTDIYRQAMDALSAKGLIYPFFCTRAQLHAAQAPNLGDRESVYSRACLGLSPEDVAQRQKTRSPAMRLCVPDEEVSFLDGHFGPVCENLARDSGDPILRRSDGLFGYQLAVVVDDALCGVTEIVRGRDILFSTPRQMFLQRELGYETPAYRHIPLLMDAHGRRLAKRDKDLGLDAFAKLMTPEQILGMLAYSAGIIPENMPMSLPALTKAFDWNNVSKDDIRLAYAPGEPAHE